jgi:predicted glycosyltransferase
MPDAQRQELMTRARNIEHVAIEEFTNDMMSYMAAADLIVSMGGYNTVCEILTLKKRAIIVPRVQPVQEQLIRVQRMSRLGLLRYIHPDELSPAALMHDISQELQASNVHNRALYNIDMNGLPRIAKLLSTPSCAYSQLASSVG